jgi:hypothetical protein
MMQSEIDARNSTGFEYRHRCAVPQQTTFRIPAWLYLSKQKLEYHLLLTIEIDMEYWHACTAASNHVG